MTKTPLFVRLRQIEDKLRLNPEQMTLEDYRLAADVVGRWRRVRATVVAMEDDTEDNTQPAQWCKHLDPNGQGACYLLKGHDGPHQYAIVLATP